MINQFKIYLTNFISIILIMLASLLFLVIVISIKSWLLEKSMRKPNELSSAQPTSDSLLIFGEQGTGKTHFLKNKVSNDNHYQKEIFLQAWDYKTWKDFILKFAEEISNLNSLSFYWSLRIKLSAFFYKHSLSLSGKINTGEYKFRCQTLKKAIDNRNKNIPLHIYIDDLERAKPGISFQILELMVFLFDKDDVVKFNNHNANISYTMDLLYFMKKSTSENVILFSRDEKESISKIYNRHPNEKTEKTDYNFTPYQTIENIDRLPTFLEKYFSSIKILNKASFYEMLISRLDDKVLQKHVRVIQNMLNYSHLRDRANKPIILQKIFNEYILNQRNTTHVVSQYEGLLKITNLKSNIGMFLVLYISILKSLNTDIFNKEIVEDIYLGTHEDVIAIFTKDMFGPECNVGEKINYLSIAIKNDFQLEKELWYMKKNNQNVSEIDGFFTKLANKIKNQIDYEKIPEIIKEYKICKFLKLQSESGNYNKAKLDPVIKGKIEKFWIILEESKIKSVKECELVYFHLFHTPNQFIKWTIWEDIESLKQIISLENINGINPPNTITERLHIGWEDTGLKYKDYLP